MPKQTTINDAGIRAASVSIEQLAHNIQSQAALLSQQFDALYPNLAFIDSTKDSSFERYMFTLARAKSLCDVMPSLICQARKMQNFGLPAEGQAQAGLPQPDDLNIESMPGIYRP